MRKGFTLIELLIVLAILALVAVTVVLTLNPAELLRQARDTRRVAEIKTLNTGIGAFRGASSNTSLGTSTVVYVSLPDSDPTCASHTLPTLPGGWTYACAPESTFRLLDGTGWIPLNVSALARYVSVSALPVDPVNNADGRYYTYTADGNEWELNANMESTKLSNGGAGDVESRDGGDNADRYELGRSLILMQ